MKQLSRGVLVLLVLAASHAAMASVALRLSLDEMVAEAQAIVHGQVVAQESVWEGNLIVTHVEVLVIESYKGPHHPGERVVIHRQGGRVGDLAMITFGEPGFATGEEVLLFLEERPDGNAPLVLGMAQGKFSVVAETGTDRLMVTRTLDGLDLIDMDVEWMRQHDEIDNPVLEAEPPWMVLEEFKREIERLVREQEGR